MKKWKVTLPGDQYYRLESDTPHEDLAAQGYDRYALEEMEPRHIPAWSKLPELPDPQYRVPQWALDTAISGLFELGKRLEIKAASFASLQTRDGRTIADDRLEQAEQVTAAANYFGSL